MDKGSAGKHGLIRGRRSFGALIDAGIPDEDIMKEFHMERQELERKKAELLRIREEAQQKKIDREKSKLLRGRGDKT